VKALAGALAALASSCTAAMAGEPPAPPRVAIRCATCHGVQGISTTPDAPNLAGQPRMYLAEQMRAFRDGARKQPVMTMMAKGLDDEAIEAIAEYYAGFAVELRERR
jgi:cytochrome c553